MSQQDMSVGGGGLGLGGLPLSWSQPVGSQLVPSTSPRASVARPWADHLTAVMAANLHFAGRLQSGHLSHCRGDYGLMNDLLRNVLSSEGMNLGGMSVDECLERLEPVRDTLVRLLTNDKIGTEHLGVLVSGYCGEEGAARAGVGQMGHVLTDAGLTHDEAKALRKFATDKHGLMMTALKVVTCGDMRQALTRAQQNMPELGALIDRLDRLDIYKRNEVLSALKRLDKNFRLGIVSADAHDGQPARHFLADALELLLPPEADAADPVVYNRAVLERAGRAQELMSSLLARATREGKEDVADQVLTKAAKRSGDRALMLGDVKRRFADQASYGEHFIWAARATSRNRSTVAEYLMDNRNEVSRAGGNDERLLQLSSRAVDKLPSSGGGGGGSCCSGPMFCFCSFGGGGGGDDGGLALAILVIAIALIAFVLIGLAIWGICAAVHAGQVNSQIKAMEA